MVAVTVDRYSHVECRKKEGAHYTPDFMSDFMSEQLISNCSLKDVVNIVDPAIGDGELLVSLIHNLQAKGVKNICAYGFDTNEESIKITQSRLKNLFPDVSLHLEARDFLELCLRKDLNDPSVSYIPTFDLLIANPPYIRTQVLGADKSQELSEQFGLKGRLDIYQAFLIGMKAVLNEDSVASVIVSNRFLTTKGTGEFREKMYAQYSLLGMWDFGDTRIFEAAVLPAVMTLKLKGDVEDNYAIPFVSVYLSDEEVTCDQVAENQVDALNYSGCLLTKNQSKVMVKHGHMVFDDKPKDVWRLQDEESEAWLNTVAENTWCTFKDVGKVRVGVKTTADNVFIKEDWEAEQGYEPELLKPLTTHHVGGRFRANGKKLKSILYTHHMVNGKKAAIPLDDYPLSTQYLESHREQLEGRKYVIKAKRAWYEIWVPQNPALWDEPKVVFRDITEQPMFWMDTGSVINGDCYWMIRDKNNLPEDILWLVLAVANSTFIETFYDIKFQNKLYSNKRRFITQYVEKFPLPNPESEISLRLIDLSKSCASEPEHAKRLLIEQEIDQLVWDIFQAPKI